MFAPKNFGFLQGYFRSFPNDFYYKNKRMRERERERERESTHRFSRPILYEGGGMFHLMNLRNRFIVCA